MSTRRLVPLLASALGAGCSAGDLTLPSGSEPAVMRIVGGDAQQAPVRSWLPQPLTIQVLDAAQHPIQNAQAEFAFLAETPGFSVDPGTVATDEKGQAAVRARLGDDPGTHFVAGRLPREGAPPEGSRLIKSARAGTLTRPRDSVSLVATIRR